MDRHNLRALTHYDWMQHACPFKTRCISLHSQDTWLRKMHHDLLKFTSKSEMHYGKYISFVLNGTEVIDKIVCCLSLCHIQGKGDYLR